MSSVKFSIITCSYKPDRKTLKRVFAGIRGQTLPSAQWEYLIIDNDGLDSLRPWVDLSWHPSARIIVENRVGLANARMRGMAESKGDYILFVDQDNILEPDYLETALDIFARHPFIGSLGGFSVGEYEGNVEPWMHEILNTIMDCADCDAKKADLQYAMAKHPGPWIPMGAGMIVTRQVAQQYMQMIHKDQTRTEFGRKGKSLMGSEDVDLALVAIDLNRACGMSSRLKLTHVIPPWRTELGYLRRLLYSSNYATARLLIIRGWRKEQTRAPVTWMDRLRKLKSRFVSDAPEIQCWKAFSKGYQDGITGMPFDETYS